MNLVARKNELLQKAQTTGLTMLERGELRELALWEQKQSDRARSSLENSVKDFQSEHNALDTPRHRAEERNISFDECPLCRKNRNINSKLLREYNHMIRYPDDYCKKRHLHNDKTYQMMIVRGRIDLDRSGKCN